MALIFHERVGLDGRRISPFSWRIRYAFAHKGLEPEVVPTRFADVDRIRRLSGQHFVPIIEHDGAGRARQLVDRLPSRGPVSPIARHCSAAPSGRGASRLVNNWSDTVLAARCGRRSMPISSGASTLATAAYFRGSRETQLGMTLEEYSADRDRHLPV